MIKKLYAGTRIYLKKDKPYPLYIQPDKSLMNDSLYVAYDVKINGETMIPRGTRVLGDWVTETYPEFGAQLQIHWIFLDEYGQSIHADSKIIQDLSDYNNEEVDNANYLYKHLQYKAPSNIVRRIVNARSKTRTLMDNKTNSIYFKIQTQEIPVILAEDFIPFDN